jgi:excisionase family DNA binding protein
VTTGAGWAGHEASEPQAQAAVRRALECAAADGTFAVLLLDATDVGRVDRAHGHAAGDALLEQLEARVRAAAPAKAFARLTRERIVAVVETRGGEADAVELAQALAAAARAPLDVEDATVRLDATVGLALTRAGSGTAAALLRDADAAAHQARLVADGTPWRLADVGAHERALRRLRLEDELAAALARGELALYFQPIVSPRRGTLVGIEALVRWRHPARGLLGPAQFLPVAEESGLIVELGAWVLDAVLAQVGEWGASRPERVLPPVALNVSGRELREASFASRFADALLSTGVPPETIALEVADPGALDASPAVEQALAALRGLGVRIVLDHFGGAHSSLAQLARLPIDGLKLDRALLDAQAGAAGEAPIAEAVIGLAHALGLSIAVPGIETEQQLSLVRALHVDAAQGHLIARPAPATSLADLEALELDRLTGGRGAGAGARGGEAADDLLPLSAVAEALGVSPSTVRRLADQGALPGTRTEGGHRRFLRADVQRLARERRRAPSLRPWELPATPLPVSAELIRHEGRALAERAARALYEPQRPGWFATPQGLARASGWVDALAEAFATGAARAALAASAAYAEAATLGGASPPEVVRFLGQFAALASAELVRTRSASEEARGLQRVVNAATEEFLGRL